MSPGRPGRVSSPAWPSSSPYWGLTCSAMPCGMCWSPGCGERMGQHGCCPGDAEPAGCSPSPPQTALPAAFPRAPPRLHPLRRAASHQTTDLAERSPRFAGTPSPCLCVQYLVLMALTRSYTVQSPSELLLFWPAQLYTAARVQRDLAWRGVRKMSVDIMSFATLVQDDPGQPSLTVAVTLSLSQDHIDT